MTNTDDFGTRLLNMIQRQGLTEQELAKRVGISAATLSRYILGCRQPKVDVLAKIALALGTTSDYLIGIEKEDFDLCHLEMILLEHSKSLSIKEKKKLIFALLNDE